MGARLVGQDFEWLIVESIVMSAVFEFFLDALAYLHAIVAGADCQIAQIEKVVQVGSQEDMRPLADNVVAGGEKL